MVDFSKDTVAVPANWQIPAGTESQGYRFVPSQDVAVSLDDPEHDLLVRGLLREAFKRAFKDASDSQLGPLWQHYNDFCQVPAVDTAENFLFCRKFGVDTVPLKGRRWCVQIRVSTQTVDGQTFADYFQMGEAERLAELIELKRKNRATRKNRPTDVAVLRMQTVLGDDTWDATRLELDNPDAFVAACSTAAEGHQAGAMTSAVCKSFKHGAFEVPLADLRLILDTQITQEEHRETILEPGERADLWNVVRELLSETEVFGTTVTIASRPVNAGNFEHGVVGPPAIRIRDRHGEGVLVAPDRITVASLRKRGRARADALKKHGLLQHRPMNPLLACPAKYFAEPRAERLMYDLNQILEVQNLPFRFKRFDLYQDAYEVHQALVNGDFDSVLAVLPEGRRRAQTRSSTHELLKRKLVVPSQCIQHDNTYFDKTGRYRTPKCAGGVDFLPNRIRNHYINCIWGLAVKNHYVPFAPAESFKYNVHVGIDVGGRDNNKAMLCVGYGFQNPRERLVFLTEELPVEGAKAEPIPVDALVQGITGAFQKLASEFNQAGRSFDLTRVLFVRDGSLLGDAPRWNERDAFAPVFEEAKRRGWADPSALWSVAEVSKSAEGWRVLAHVGEVRNPIVGQWIAPFDDRNRVILSTTGAPYLTQGTASPLLIQIGDLVGRANRDAVLRDIVWEADMCFTKPDMGMKLPWVLYVANAGALQAARSYEITGVPV